MPPAVALSASALQIDCRSVHCLDHLHSITESQNTDGLTQLISVSLLASVFQFFSESKHNSPGSETRRTVKRTTH